MSRLSTSTFSVQTFQLAASGPFTDLHKNMILKSNFCEPPVGRSKVNSIALNISAFHVQKHSLSAIDVQIHGQFFQNFL
jgi:hypothetical protein